MLRVRSSSARGAGPCGLEEATNLRSSSLVLHQFFEDCKCTFVFMYVDIGVHVCQPCLPSTEHLLPARPAELKRDAADSSRLAFFWDAVVSKQAG